MSYETLLGELGAGLEADPAARVVVLRGAGERALCVGDLAALSDDAREGIAAFFEKRPARWTGR